jgi:hypothetical protein
VKLPLLSACLKITLPWKTVVESIPSSLPRGKNRVSIIPLITMQMNALIDDFLSAVQEIPLFTTDDILVEQYMPCAVSMPCSPVLLPVWWKMRTSQKSHLHSSSCNGYPFSLKINMSLSNTGPGRSTKYIKSSRSWYLVSLSVSWRRLKRTS